MKKMIMVCLVALAAVAVNAETVTQTFAAVISCENCAKKVTDNVPTLGKGIKDVQVSVADQTVTVTYDSEKNSAAGIIAGLAKLDVKATQKQGCSKQAGQGCCKQGAPAEGQGCCKQAGQGCSEQAGQGCSKQAAPADKGCCKQPAPAATEGEQPAVSKKPYCKIPPVKK